MTEADLKAIRKQEERERVERRREIRRQIRLAVLTGRTVPYSLDTLVESGVGVATIRKVYRKGC